MDRINWSLINSFGKLKFSKSSYYYLVIIPILVKITEYLDNPFIIVLSPNSFQLNLELPFSWYMFYFGAIFISIGTLIYQLFCPDLIKKYRSYGQFLDDGIHDEYLFKVKSKYASDLDSFGFDIRQKPYVKIKKNTFKEMTLGQYDYEPNLRYEEDRKVFFNRLYEKVNNYNQVLIFLSFFTFIIGFALFFYVIIENIQFVINHIF